MPAHANLLPMLSRRALLASAAALAATQTLPGQTRLNLAEIDRNRILAAAATALARPVQPSGDPASQSFLDLTLDIPALAAANLIDRDLRYSAAALPHLKAWLLSPQFRLASSPRVPADVAGTAALAELALSLPFLFAAEDLSVYKPWFGETLATLNDSRTAGLARDTPDHIGASWLLQVASYARLLADEPTLAAARHRFKTQTVRAQINAAGAFPHEITTLDPFRNSLFTLDLLAGVCVLLSTPYESLWNHELQDGPGMRTAVAHHAPYLARPSTWPYPADDSHFHELPCRRPALLFAARAYSVADYATIWRTLTPAQPSTPDVLRTFPIRQPILWQTPPPRL